MLRLTVSTEEYLMIGEDISLVFLGGTGNHLRIMVDAPKEKNIVRSTFLKGTSQTRSRGQSSPNIMHSRNIRRNM